MSEPIRLPRFATNPESAQLTVASVSCYYDAFGRYRCRNNGFSSWGRWVLLGLIIAVAVCFILW